MVPGLKAILAPLAGALLACLALTAGPAIASVSVNGTDVTTGGGNGWMFADGVVSLTNAGPFVITGEDSTGGTRIEIAVDSTVTLSDLILNTYEQSGSAFSLADGVSADLRLAGSNTLVSASNCAGIAVPAASSLSISRATGFLVGCLYVAGGPKAAGIGGMYGQTSAGTVTVSGGCVYATGGSDAAGIGGAFRKNGGTVVVTGGTLSFGTSGLWDIGAGSNGKTGGPVTIAGGSVATTLITTQPTDALGNPVYRVTVTNLSANAKVLFAGLGEYGQTDLYADERGMAYLWLTNGVHAFRTSAAEYSATVAGAGVTATQLGSGSDDPDDPEDPEPDPEPILEPEEEPGTPVRVNGRFVSEGPADGDSSWSYANAILTLRGTGPFVISGSDVTGGVRVVVESDAAVRLSNLVLTNAAMGASSFAVNSGVSVALSVGGTNVLASGQGAAGLHVPPGAAATIGPRDARAGGVLTAVGGQGGAGIGGAMFAGMGSLAVIGVTVVAEAGYMAKPIGGGVGGSGGAVTIVGGSVKTVSSDASSVDNAPTNSLGEAVWCVTVPGFAPGASVVPAGLGDYGTGGMLSDSSGRLYLWLTNGVYSFKAGGAGYAATVDGAAVTAEELPEVTDPAELVITGFSYESGVATIAFTTDLNAADFAAWCAEGTLSAEYAPTVEFGADETKKLVPVLGEPTGTSCSCTVTLPASASGFLRLTTSR